MASSNPNRLYDLVIFDCDGVLVDSEGLSESIIVRLLSELGVSLTGPDVNRLSQGLSDQDMWAMFEREFKLRIPNELIERFDREEAAVMRAELKAVPGVEDVLRRLTHGDQRICVASSGSKTKMSITLDETSLEPFFNGQIFSASQVANGKPAPDLFLFAAESMGTEPERCVVIEDSRNGVLAGLAAGMTVLGFAPLSSGAKIDDLGVPLFASMADLPTLLGLEDLRF